MKTGAGVFVALRLLGSAASRKSLQGDGAFRRNPAQGGRYLRGAILGIALSLVPFIVVLVVADGMIEGISARYLETYAYHFQANPLRSFTAGEFAAAASSLVGQVPGVVGAWPEIRGAALLVAKGESAPAMVRGIDPALLADPGVREFLIASEGSLSLDKGRILVGKTMADNLGIKVGETLSLLTTGDPRGRGARARTALFRVSGIVSAGYRDLDELWVFVPLATAERILPANSRQELIGIKVADPYADPESERSALGRRLNGAAAPGITDWIVRPWKEVERNLFASFATTRALLLIIMALTICVAAINVSSALVMLVLERSRDIAILKSTGASDGLIAQVFLIAGGVTGLAGSLIGVGFGALAAWRVNDLIGLLERAIGAIARLLAFVSGAPPPLVTKLLDPAYYLETIPVRLDPAELVLVGGATVLLCLAASILPALRAARLPPLEIFRKA